MSAAEMNEALNTAKKGIVVLSDFDCTITFQDVERTLITRFGDPSCLEITEKWTRGEISTMEEYASCFATISAGKLEMEAFLKGFSIDPSFPPFFQFCQDMEYKFAIVSEGLEWYIEYILQQHGFIGVDIYANRIHFESTGFRFSFPWYDPSTPLKGTSKSKIAHSYQSNGYKVIFIGDGLSDTDIALVADVVYARDELINFTQSNGIEAISYDNFADILMLWNE